jgi:hypothetical protein
VVANLELGVEALARLAGDDRVKTPYPRLAVGLEQPVDPQDQLLARRTQRAQRGERLVVVDRLYVALRGAGAARGPLPAARCPLPAAGSIPKRSVRAAAGFPLA